MINKPSIQEVHITEKDGKYIVFKVAPIQNGAESDGTITQIQDRYIELIMKYHGSVYGINEALISFKPGSFYNGRGSKMKKIDVKALIPYEFHESGESNQFVKELSDAISAAFNYERKNTTQKIDNGGVKMGVGDDSTIGEPADNVKQQLEGIMTSIGYTNHMVAMASNDGAYHLMGFRTIDGNWYECRVNRQTIVMAPTALEKAIISSMVLVGNNS